MDLRSKAWKFTAVLLACAVGVVVIVLLVGTGSTEEHASKKKAPAPAPQASGVTRTPLGEAAPSNAPGQKLYLQQVTIAAHAKLPEHFHEGTQVAHVVSGTLTYNIVSGTAAVMRANGKTQDIAGPNKVLLQPGPPLVETASLVHYGANGTSKPVVIELAALL